MIVCEFLIRGTKVKGKMMKLFVLVLMCVFGLNFSAHAGDYKWKKVSEKKGITVYKKKVKDSKLFAFKGEGVIDAPILHLLTILSDVDIRKKWMPKLADVQMLNLISPDERVEYARIDMPWPLNDRYFITHGKALMEGDSLILDSRSVDFPNFTIPNHKFVKGIIHKSIFKLTPMENGKKTLFDIEVYSDPKGYIPGWVVNYFQKRWAYEFISNGREQVKTLTSSDLMPTPNFLKVPASFPDHAAAK